MRSKVRLMPLAFLASAAGCQTIIPNSTPSHLQSNTPVEKTVEGWLRVHGEVMIYDSRESMDEKDQQHCLSGMPTSGSYEKFRRFDGKRATVTGVIVKYSELQNENTPVLPRKVFGGNVISNFCLKDNVILIDNIIDEH